jgi:hypothetical protein
MESKTVLYTKNKETDLVNMIAAEVSNAHPNRQSASNFPSAIGKSDS